jgi:hypothetical protein
VRGAVSELAVSKEKRAYLSAQHQQSNANVVEQSAAARSRTGLYGTGLYFEYVGAAVTGRTAILHLHLKNGSRIDIPASDDELRGLMHGLCDAFPRCRSIVSKTRLDVGCFDHRLFFARSRARSGNEPDDNGVGLLNQHAAVVVEHGAGQAPPRCFPLLPSAARLAEIGLT